MNMISNDPECKNKIVVFTDKKFFNDLEMLAEEVNEILDRRKKPSFV